MRPLRFTLPILMLGTLEIASGSSAYDEAVTAMQAGDYELGAVRLQEVLERSPEWAPGHVALGQCRYLLGDPESAEASFRRAVEVDPATDLSTPYTNVGKLLYRDRRFEEAIPALERGIERAPEAQQPSLLLMLSYAHLRTGNTQQARNLLDDHLTRHAPDPKASRYLGLACQRLGDYPCALSSLRQAIAAGSDDPDVFRSLAEWSRYWALLLANADSRGPLLSNSVDDTRAWYRNEPASDEAREIYSRTLLDAGHARELIEEFGQGDDVDCGLLALLARAYNVERRLDEAEQASRRAIRCAPEAPGPRVALASSLVRRLRSEQSDLDAVRADIELARQALDALGPALEGADPDERATTLASDVGKTLEALARAEQELIRADQDHIDEIEEEIRRRCRGIRWVVRSGQRDLTPEERSFNERHDCRHYAADPRPAGS